MKSIAIGSERDRVEIVVRGYQPPLTGDQPGDHWLAAEVILDAGAFGGRFAAAFLAADFAAFRDELQPLLDTLQGRAEFHTLEEQLTLMLEGDGLGEISVTGVALDQPGIGNRLEFGLFLDQAQLRETFASLEALLSAYPVRV
ncbi:WapI family immunity protein [Solimonas soli]|uniref:WapI family immunity protein n=1 Tax=Solimonas soli TaxID=413479 RepID=UPI0004B62715|nr:hypothetical protein [Solimonas soli]